MLNAVIKKLYNFDAWWTAWKHKKTTFKECFGTEVQGPQKREASGICPVCPMVNSALPRANQIDNQTIFSRAPTRSRMKTHLSKKHTYKKRLKSRKFNEENFWTTRKSFEFQEKIELPFVIEKNVGKALISADDLRLS